MAKLTRRSFLGVLSAIPFTPLIAKDMADFDFDSDFDFLLPSITSVEPELPLPKPIPTLRPFEPVLGQLRYNIRKYPNNSVFEVYTSNGWQIVETTTERQS